VTLLWAVHLTTAARSDFRDIVRWTIERFGEEQARVYADILRSTLNDLRGGPSIIGVKRRDDIAKGLFTVHVTRNGQRGRHFVLFRIRPDQVGDTLEILRLLHDAMDLQRHVGTRKDTK
jgi:toxin ParE1/3/4